MVGRIPEEVFGGRSFSIMVVVGGDGGGVCEVKKF